MEKETETRLRTRVIKLERRVNALTKEKKKIEKKLFKVLKIFNKAERYKGVPPLTDWPLHYRIQNDPDKVDDWLKIFVEKHNLEVEDLTGQGRQSHLIAARHVAMWFLKQNTPFSFCHIGSIFNRDHSTVMHAERKVKDYIEAGDRTIKFSLDMCNLSAAEIWPAPVND
jgi:hypothetical protein